ncbi:acyltransferase family protein [Legionella tucsonensis]|uniref:O-antigen acetylase n=1 Tax=Legionella tucsonensis TaxID=40335 RepID=A0A0W0ZSP8_9GAMM|nr:acyltransferase family protein [Legionella tucsonensis]KTD72239.1 O-antigen acetylase [Legionella tucsonensis]
MHAFRNDINGLRAWAVIAVIFFHFQLFKFTGGFAGVDVFFVISGFLMTKIITDDLFNSNNTFSSILLRFYLLRARRIIPSLFVLCVILVALGYYVLPAHQYNQLSKHIISALGFFSNFEFLNETGYFDALANTKWLLHTWSLSIEWQFYLVLPIILIVAYKIYPKGFFIKLILSLCAILSLLYSVIITKYSPEFSFYMLPTRAWEMLMGGCIYLYLDNFSFKERMAKCMEYSGFLLIIASFFIFTTESVWPGWLATIPVIGTTLIITAKRNNSILTSNRLFQYLGRISYSLYLYHWPVYVFLVYFEMTQNTIYIVIALIFTLICAHLSYLFIETPSKYLFSKKTYYTSLITIIFPICIFLIIPLYIISQEGFVSTLAFQVQKISAEAKNKNPREQQCGHLNINNPEKPKECTYGGKDLGIILLGDSHASAVVLALEKALPNKNLHVLDWSILACPAALRYTSGPETYKKCAISNQFFLKKSKNIPSNIPLLMVNFANHEDRMELACEMAKDRPVYLLRPTPVMPVHVPDTMAKNILRKKRDIRIKIDARKFDKYSEKSIELQNKTAKTCGVKILEVTPYLCKRKYCYGDLNGLPIYYDAHHLNLRGADLLIPEFNKIFKSQSKKVLASSIDLVPKNRAH